VRFNSMNRRDVFILLLTVAIVLNLIATVCLMRSAVYSTSQKRLQLALVWAVPLVGAILVLSVWAHDRKSASRDPVRYDEGSWLAGIGPENDHGKHRGSLGDSSSHDGHGADGGGSGD
jgi:hypothetical protein